MQDRIQRLTTFLKFFYEYTAHVGELIVGLLIMIVLGGVAISWLEGMSLGEGIYFAFITALTIGYGDFTPATVAGRVAAIMIGMVGMVFVGLTVAIANRALHDAILGKRHDAKAATGPVTSTQE